MSYMLEREAVDAVSASPMTSWQRSEASLRDILLERCEEIVLNRDHAIQLLWAVETGRHHPHKAEFLRINRPVFDAWKALRQAIDDPGTPLHWQH